MRILFTLITLLLAGGFAADGELWPALLPQLPPFSTRLLWLVGIALLGLLIWGTPKVWQSWRRRGQANEELLYLRREKKLIRRHLKDLRLQLRRQFRGGANPYHLPWVLVIGPEKAGTSHWLAGAGFEPVCRKEESFNAEVQFWLSEQAVAVEVSAVLLRQENNLLEQPIWEYLLQQLRLHRPRQPLSSMLLMMDARRLQGATESEQEQLIHLYRRRVLDVQAACGVDLPVLLQVTQADQLDGFEAYSAALGSSDRQQPLGFVVEQGQTFNDVLHQWQHSVAAPLLTLLQNQTALPRRQSLMRFILQLELAQQRLGQIFQGLNQNDRYGPGIRLEGCFISSAGQQGAAYPWLARQLVSGQFRCSAPPAQLPGQEAIFLGQQLPRLLQPLAAKLGQNPLAATGWRLSVAVSLLALLTLLGGAFQVYWLNVQHNQQLEGRIEQALLRYEIDMAEARPEQLAPMITPLIQLRSLVDDANQQRPWYLSIGLFDQRLAQSVRTAYENQLAQRLLPLVSRLAESNLAAYIHLADADGVFDHLLHYLMLYNHDLRDGDALTHYMLRSLLVHEDILQQEEQPLNVLFSDLWATGAVPASENNRLVAEAREQLSQIIDERLVYDYIRARPALSDSVDMRERLSSSFRQVFEFNAGFEGYYIPYLYTLSGFNVLDLSANSELLREAIDRLEKVKTGKLKASYATRSRISDRVRELYFADYIQRWRDFVSNIRLRETTTPAELSRLIAQLYSGEQPALYRLAELIAAETRLAQPVEDKKPSKAQKQAEKKVAKALKIKGPAQKALSKAANDRLAKLAAQRNASIVNRAFDSYATLQASHAEQINEAMMALQDTRRQLSNHNWPEQANWELVRQIAKGESNVLDDLTQRTRLLPKQVRGWFTSLNDQVWDQWLLSTENYLQERWEEEVYSSYRQQLAGRFPLANGAKREVRLGTFANFYKPDGVVDSFFDNYLSEFVDTRGRHWAVRSSQRHGLAISGRYLKTQQYLGTVQNLLFAADSSQLDIRYQLRPEQLSVDVTTFGMRDGQQQLLYRHGPRQWRSGSWPVQEGDPDLTLYFENNGLRLAQQRFTGPWALWRFAYASKQAPRDDGVQFEFSLRDYQVRLEMQLDNSGNPFDPALLKGLVLPKRIIAGG